MEFNLNKNKYSGGLYFSSIVALPLITSCCYAGLVETELETVEDLHHFTLSLEFKSNVASKLSQENCADWIKEEKYKDSIYNVISNAIADCVLKKNEFAKKKMKNGVVTFENDNYAGYSAENWNAVVLYNLIYYIYENQESNVKCAMNKFYEEYIESKKLQNICGIQFVGGIKKAFDDITEYNRNLDIITHVKKQTTEDRRRCVAKKICEDYNNYGLAKLEMTHRFTYKNGGKTEQDSINIYVENRKIAKAIVYADDAMYSCDFDDYMNIISKDKIADYEYNKHSDGDKKKILDIVANCTFKEKEIELTPTKKDIDNVLDIGWYTDKAGIVHLAWMDVNKSYMSKAYMRPLTRFNIRLNLEDTPYQAEMKDCVKIDNKCFREIDLEQSIYIAEEMWRNKYNNLSDKDTFKYVTYVTRSAISIGNPHGYKLLMPRCCEELIYSSSSITSIDLSKADFSGTENYNDMIAQNTNISRIGPFNKLHIKNCKASSMSNLINSNANLSDINLKIESAKWCNLKGLIQYNESLSKIEIDVSEAKMKDILEVRKIIENRHKGSQTIEIKLPFDKEKLLDLWKKARLSEYGQMRKLEDVPNDARIKIYAVDQDLKKDSPVIDGKNTNKK